jgi:hypothetical protein
VWGDLSVEDYVKIADLDEKPLRWMAGAHSVENAKNKAHDLVAQAEAHLDLATGLDH